MQRDHPVGERIRLEGERCVYCGERATCWDHFPPYTVDQLRGWLLPACGECNGLAGDRHPYDFPARAAYVNRALVARYRRVLDSTPWSPAELRGLGRGLADSIEPLAHARLIARERVRWDAVAYLATLGLGARFIPVSTKPDWQAPIVTELEGGWRTPEVIERRVWARVWRGFWQPATGPFEDQLTEGDWAMLLSLLHEAYILAAITCLPDSNDDSGFEYLEAFEALWTRCWPRDRLDTD
jgi:hypothetical protein